MSNYLIKHNELNAQEFISLWESVWGEAPSFEQVKLAMEHTLFRVSVFDGDKVIAMARMLGDLGMDYYIKDVVVRPEYQKKGLGRLLIQELMNFIKKNGIAGTNIFVELCAEPDKIPFYEKFGFDSNEDQRLKMMCHIE
ncbi:MAG: GNAT family N-acetyltransferase [Treponema sp.]|nr:GNAT family N-acetyltransferase [Treponema sp.]